VQLTQHAFCCFYAHTECNHQTVQLIWSYIVLSVAQFTVTNSRTHLLFIAARNVPVKNTSTPVAHTLHASTRPPGYWHQTAGPYCMLIKSMNPSVMRRLHWCKSIRRPANSSRLRQLDVHNILEVLVAIVCFKSVQKATNKMLRQITKKYRQKSQILLRWQFMLINQELHWRSFSDDYTADFYSDLASGA